MPAASDASGVAPAAARSGAGHDKCVCYTGLVCARVLYKLGGRHAGPAQEALMDLSAGQACSSRGAFRENRRRSLRRPVRG